MTTYFHPGWTGEPYKSDFEAKWGLIKLDEMLDCTECENLGEVANKARAAKSAYALANIVSKHGCRLYKITATQTPKCVFTVLEQRKRNAKRQTNVYRSDIEERTKQILRMVKQRCQKKGLAYDLDEADIMARVKKGVCEATGIPLNLKHVNSPYAPSLDQIIPGTGYTQTNVQVVCMIYNGMKSDYTLEQVDDFIERLKRVG